MTVIIIYMLGETKKLKRRVPTALYLEILFTIVQREVNTIVLSWNTYNCFVKLF